MKFPIEYDPQSNQYYVIDSRPHAADRFVSQHDTKEDAEDAANDLRVAYERVDTR